MNTEEISPLLNTPDIFVEVAIAVPMRRTFTYLLPTNIQQPAIQAGERVLVPFSGRKVIGAIVSIRHTCELDKSKLKEVIERVDPELALPQQLVTFLHSAADYYHHPLGEVFQLALPVMLRQTDPVNTAPVKVWQVQTALDDDAVNSKLARSAKQQALFTAIAQHPGMSWSELRTLGYDKTQLNALVKKELIQEVDAAITAFNWQDSFLNQQDKHTLNAEQATVVAGINAEATFACHLIDGVTGSGKTEVYLQVMEQVLKRSQQVLILVPEIGLTPQTLSRFEQRFNVPIYLHHSGLNDRERLDTWLSAHRGSAAIVIGTRSALFSPLQSLGMIIVDEEHDASFKQQDSFRYHGRDLAILRAKQCNIPIVLGSATPSFETLHNAMTNKFRYHQLQQRAGSSQHAAISLVDVSSGVPSHGFSETLLAQMKATLARGEQVLVFLNRRGYAPAIHCQECRWVVECQRCNKPYTFHHKDQRLICHHCTGQKRVPTQCGQCGSIRLATMGRGTEQLEEKVAHLFPNTAAIRIDRDSTRQKGAMNQLLTDIHENKYQLLIGTQMLAKGHHFPNVTLVAILDADGALFSFDYRATEQLAQLLIQVAGRAGRASKPGKVLLQTQYPEHPLLQDLVHNGYQHFSQQALLEREQAQLPPFHFQALVRAEANYPSYPEKFLRELANEPYVHCQLTGPLPASMEKKAGKYRYHLNLHSVSRKALHHAVAKLIQLANAHPLTNKVRWTVDIDPTELSW